MEKIDSLKKIKEISDYIITLSVFAFISGIIIFIWFGFGLGKNNCNVICIDDIF